jgi:hypothetical protein
VAPQRATRAGVQALGRPAQDSCARISNVSAAARVNPGAVGAPHCWRGLACMASRGDSCGVPLCSCKMVMCRWQMPRAVACRDALHDANLTHVTSIIQTGGVCSSNDYRSQDLRLWLIWGNNAQTIQ